jgi:maltose-binding protein MalE
MAKEHTDDVPKELFGSHPSRRKFVKAAGATGIITGGFAGCTGGNSSGSSPTSTSESEIVPGERDFSGVELSWWDHESPTLEALRKFSQEWAEKTGAEVSFTLGQPDRVRDKEQTVFNSGSPEIDIAGHLYSWLPRYAEGGHLMDMSSHVERLHSGWKENDWVQAVWEIDGTYQDRDGFYAMPTKFDVFNHWHNKALFEEAGLDPEKPPETMSDLPEYAKAISENTDAEGFAIPWTQFAAPWQWYLFAHKHGVPWYDENGYPAFWKEEHRQNSIKVLEMWQETTKYSPDGYGNMGYAGTTTSFIQGQVGMAYQWVAFGPTMMNPEKSNIVDDLAWGLTAAGPDNNDQLLGGWQAGVSKYSENKEAAFDCLAYVLNPENSLQGARDVGMASARQSVIGDEQVQEAQPWYDEMVPTALESAFPMPKRVGWLESVTGFGSFIQKAITNRDTDLESGLQEVAANTWETSKRSGYSPSETGQKP